LVVVLIHWEYSVMRSRLAIYQAREEACRHQATFPQNAAQKDRLLKLAEQWAEMAERVKKDRAHFDRIKRGAASSRRHLARIASFGP